MALIALGPTTRRVLQALLYETCAIAVVGPAMEIGRAHV